MKQTNFLKTMLLLCALIVGSTGVWAQEDPLYTITFKDSGTNNDGSAKKTSIADIISDGADYVSAIPTATNVYQGRSGRGLKLGTSKATGDLELTLKEAVKPSKIVATVRKYNDSGEDYIWVNGEEFTLTNSTSDDVTVEYDGDTEISSIEFKTTETDKKYRTYVIAVSVYKADETVTKHNLSSVVTPAGVGTVILGATEVGEGKSTTIVAEATNPAYKFKNWTKTSGTIADANAASTTFTMGTTDATVTANFELKPTHTITVTPTDDGTITVKNGEDEVTSGSTIYEGATLTISALAGENKEFASWSVTGATPENATENPTTLTVGENNITIAATFNTITTHKISWSVNDVIVKSENIKEGDAITFAAPESGIPEGYVFKGWVEEGDKIDTPTDEDPKAKYVSSGTSTADITYYCVMAKEEGTVGTATLTASFTGTSTTWTEADYKDDQNNTWHALHTKGGSSPKYFFQMNHTKPGHIDSPKFPGKVTSIKIASYNGSGDNRSFNINSEQSIDKNGDLGTISVPANTKDLPELGATLKGTEFDQFYIYVTGSLGAYSITVTYGSVAYTNFCTTVPTTETVTKLADRTYGTYVTKNALDFTDADVEAYIAKGITGEGDAATLEIEKVTTVKAGTPIIVKSDDKSVTSANVKIITDAEAANNGDNKLVAGDGTDVTTDVAYTYYYIASDKFHKATTGSLVVGKAYLKLETASAKAFTIAIGGDGETTGINTLDSRLSTLDKAQSMYNLAGQKVSNSYKGIVIINGKKVIK